MRRMFALALSAAALLAAQGLDSLSDWQFYREISAGTATGIAALTLDADALGNASGDQGDLRIIDANGTEIPYALRALRGERRVESVETAEVSRGVNNDAAEVILDQGEAPVFHNQVQVDTQGTQFRRQVSVFGSDDAEQWTLLIETGQIMRTADGGVGASVDRVLYRPSPYRYVRIVVARDPQTDTEPPVIEAVALQRLAAIPGQEQAIAAASVVKETIVEGGGSASRYVIGLPGRVPVQGLRFDVADASFVRTYQLISVVEQNIAPFPVALGRFSRGEGEQSTVVTMRFPEVLSRQLILTILDGKEPPLEISEPVVLTASRQLVVDLGAAPAQPLKLYYGNPSAAAPGYSGTAELPQTLDEAVPRLVLGPQELNPQYEPPPVPLNEQAPWLIYVLTGAASLGLLAILRSLVFDVAS